MRRVIIIGSGGVAESLALTVNRNKELELVQVFGRNQKRVQQISQMCGIEYSADILPSDVYIISVSDSAVEEVSTSISFPEDAIVVHTAGSVEMDVIEHPRRGVLYPLQTFSVGREVDVRDVPLFVEGDKEIFDVARLLSKTVVEMNSAGRRALHLSAVFACNFVNAMYTTAHQVTGKHNLPFEYLKPLIAETCAKALSAQNPILTQTGPAVRGDKAVQQRHLAMLKDERLEEIYKIISQQIWETSKKM